VAGDVDVKAAFIVSHPHLLNRSALELQQLQEKAVQPKDMFAVVAFLGKQHKLSKDDVFVTDLIHSVNIGDEITLDSVSGGL
jgi:hypothetical protein